MKKVILGIVFVIVLGFIGWSFLPEEKINEPFNESTDVGNGEFVEESYQFKDGSFLDNSICESENACMPWEKCLTYAGRPELKNKCKNYVEGVVSRNDKESCYAFERIEVGAYCLKLLGYTEECLLLTNQNNISAELCSCKITSFESCENQYGDTVDVAGDSAKTTIEECNGLNGIVVNVKGDEICPENLKSYGQIRDTEETQVCCVE